MSNHSLLLIGIGPRPYPSFLAAHAPTSLGQAWARPASFTNQQGLGPTPLSSPLWATPGTSIGQTLHFYGQGPATPDSSLTMSHLDVGV